MITSAINVLFTCNKIEKYDDKYESIEKIWKIGGDTGWYHADWLWKLRGFIDQLFSGVGMTRGRRSSTDIRAGDTLDFWRVLYADKSDGRLLLYAEMKLPGEALYTAFHRVPFGIP